MFFVNDLNIQYGDKHLFRNVSATIHPQDRIGLVGVNGAGKSTLLRLVAGLSETDEGVISRARYATVAYLPQEVTAFPSERSLYEEAETAFAGTLALAEELESLNRRLAHLAPDSPEFALLVERHGELQHRLEQADVFRIRSTVEKVLVGLGFTPADFARPCQNFSGGWLMRLMLAKLLLAGPSLLLLDEPTNHLDLDSLRWLEDFLKGYAGAMVVISHDRAFLDNTTNLTWELALGRLTAYKGNYSQYVAEKELRLEIQRAAYANQQAKIQQTARFVERFRATSTKASQVQSRLKQLEKMERIELEETERTISFRFPPAAPCGRLALQVKGLEKAYGKTPVFAGLSLHLNRGDKMAVVGVNGAGKSTLAKILAGLEDYREGEVRLGHNARLSYFGQHQAQELPLGYTVLETLAMVGEEMTQTQLRSLLGAFLFRDDDVNKKVEVLSGGEKSRLALAKMIATPANILVLDEPTNHLDMVSQEILQEAMRQYDGTVVVVSHNRYFLNRFVNKVLEIKNGAASLFEGNIDDYLAKVDLLRQEGESQKTAAARPRPAEAHGRDLPRRGKAARQAQARLRQEKSQRLAPVREALGRTEKEIEKLEARKAELERALADPELYRDDAAFAEKSREYKRVEERIARQYEVWEKAQTEIEEIELTFASGERSP